MYLARIVRSRSGGMGFLFFGGFAAANDVVGFLSPSRSDNDENGDGFEDARYTSRKVELSSAAVEVFFPIVQYSFSSTLP